MIDSVDYCSDYGILQQTESETTTLVLASAPLNINKSTVLAIFEKAEGIRSVKLAPPVSAGGDELVRGVLIEFYTPEFCRLELLRHQRATSSPIPNITVECPTGPVSLPLSMAVEKRVRRVPCISGCSNLERMNVDLQQALKIASKLDSSFQRPSWLESDGSPLLTFERVEEKLSTALAYLREVHNYCYYCARQFVDEEELYGSCGIVYIFIQYFLY